MLRTFWDRINLLKKRRGPSEENHAPTLEEIRISMAEEFRGLRKMVRKQAVVVEGLQVKLDALPVAQRAADSSEELVRLASAFFHLDHSLQDQTAHTPQRREAVALFWLQLEQLLDKEHIQMIREPGVPFDPRLHQAVLTREPGARKNVVAEVLEPGIIQDGMVRRPATVILTPEANDQEIAEESIP